MERLLNVIKQYAGGLDQGGGQPRFGIVTSVNPAAATARVTLQPEGVLSGWLPVPVAVDRRRVGHVLPTVAWRSGVGSSARG